MSNPEKEIFKSSPKEALSSEISDEEKSRSAVEKFIEALGPVEVIEVSSPFEALHIFNMRHARAAQRRKEQKLNNE